ncbi:MAG TPA: c-type cytochrome [Shinella sp.]|jgi:cytochrome c553|uniref:c-type cytochrome n=1 Tax=Shinella sp. TaxID=1870904 RepID=UPI002E13F1C3|nr:c-type cytochrome [Shinella sp.]
MLIGWRHVVGLAIAGVAAAFLVAWSGVFGIGASSGHWKATDWFLHWAMRASVRTAALGTEVPAFSEGMLPMAAGHFERGCAICHGSPAMARPDSVRHMLPAPPDLKGLISTWSDAELFQIVRHGVRFTGMPAWPVAGREDEAWAMVAFLRRYPALDAAGYRALAGFSGNQSQAMDRIVETCNGCHAAERLGPDSLIPHLAGQSETYLADALAAYDKGARPSGIMAVAIQGLSEMDRQALARHFAGETRGNVSPDEDEQIIERGKMLAMQGDRARRIPACLSCHDKTGGNPAYPRLSGQPGGYIANQLRLFVAGSRGGGPFQALMARASENLEENDIMALSAYFAARPFK